MKFYVATYLPVEESTLLREDPAVDGDPEVFIRSTLTWEPRPELYHHTELTDDWIEISPEESQRIESHQRTTAAA